MRESPTNYSVTFLVVVLIGVVLVSTQLVAPPSVDCREALWPSDNCGDPDMPDHSMTAPGRAVDFTPLPLGPVGTVEGPSRHERDLEFSVHHTSRPASLAAERRTLLFGLWFSVASLAFAF